MSNTNTRYFQWIATDRKGDIVIYDSVVSEDGVVYINFKDGSRINEDMVAKINVRDVTGKLMAEVENPNNAWKFEDSWVGREEEKWEVNAAGENVCVQPFIPGNKVTKLIPPKISNPKKSEFGTLTVKEQMTDEHASPESSNATSPIDKPIPVQTQTDAVSIMLAGSKKIDSEVVMSVIISLPSTALFRIIDESFDNGGEKIIDYIVNDIDVSSIKASIRTALKSFYNGENKDGHDRE